MTRTLRQQQSMFARLIAVHITWIYQVDGWEVTLGDGYRGDNTGHSKNSNHYIRLAQDLNFFIDGVWQPSINAAFRIVGAHWKSLDIDCRWGGDFKNPDGTPAADSNHFSMMWRGKE
jgi:hypothetical protein